MTASVAEFVGHLKAAPESLRKGQRTAILACAAVAREAMDKSAPSHVVGGKSISVKVTPIGEESASVKWGPPGWVRILNDPTQAHIIAARGRGKGRRAGSLRRQGAGKSSRATSMASSWVSGGAAGAGSTGAINIKGVGWKAFAFHPGTKGKHFVEVGKAAAFPLVRDTYQRVGLTAPLAAVFHG